MKAFIEVKTRREARLIRRGLADPETRALVKVMGALSPIETKEMKRATLDFATKMLRQRDARSDRV